MRKIVILPLVAAAALGLSACGSGEQGANTAAANTLDAPAGPDANLTATDEPATADNIGGLDDNAAAPANGF